MHAAAVLAVVACACGATATSDEDAARADARARDARGADAPAREDVTLYAIAEGKLYELLPDTGALRELGLTQADGRTTWDRDAGILRVIRSALSNPTLGAIDRCTGAVTSGPAINDSGHRAPVAEGISQGPDGRLFVSLDTTDPIMGTTSDTLATYDPATAQATRLGPIATVQEDADAIEFAGARLLALDYVSGVGTELYELDPRDGATTHVAMLPVGLRDLAYDPVRDTVFSFDLDRRRLVRVDPSTGEVTDAAPPSYADGELGLGIGTITSAPRAVCP